MTCKTITLGTFLLCLFNSGVDLKSFELHGSYDNSSSAYWKRQWCDPVLGCLEVTSEWFSLNRPINVLPDSRSKINTRFYLHTREEPNTNEDFEVSVENLALFANTSFQVSKQTKILVHGYFDTADTKWMKEMSAALLKYGDYNVLRVNWGARSKSLYPQATADTRVVGLEIGYFINNLVSNWGLDPKTVHCIGHSLGSHACGYGGEKINKMGRISGLDPAGPFFSGTPDFVHLDLTDASFVDIIHTDGDSIFTLGYGMSEPMGHLDFYVNSGHDQPGCDPLSITLDVFIKDLIEEGRLIFSCSHLRSIEYYMESLSSNDCQWVAHECHDYKSFKQGQCYTCDSDNSRCAFLGIEAEQYLHKERQFVQMFIETNKKTPFCIQHYQVVILTAYPKKAERWVMGTLYLWLYGDTRRIIKKIKITDKHERIEHGQKKSSLFVSSEDVGHVYRIELKWVYNDQLFNPGSYCISPFCNRNLYVQTVSLSPMNRYPEEVRKHDTVEACLPNGSTMELKDGHKRSVMTTNDCVHI